MGWSVLSISCEKYSPVTKMILRIFYFSLIYSLIGSKSQNVKCVNFVENEWISLK